MIVCILLALFLNTLLGCAICAAIDTPDRALFRWANECPLPFGVTVVANLWPVMLYFWWVETSTARP